MPIPAPDLGNPGEGAIQDQLPTLPLAWLRSLVHAATGGSWHAAGRSWASKKAPAAAVQTEYDSGASGPSAVVMAMAKVRSRTPLASEARRTRTPARKIGR